MTKARSFKKFVLTEDSVSKNNTRVKNYAE